MPGPARATEFDWSPAGQLGLSRYGAAAARLPDGRVLVVGGKDQWSHPPTAAAELYDPAKNAWTPAPPTGTARSYPSAVTLKDGRVLVAGGEEDASKTSAEIFDPATGSWTPAASSTSDQVFTPAVRLADGRVLFVGGYVFSSQWSGGEIYDPAADRWTLAGPMHEAGGTALAVSVLHDGRVLAVGGEDEPAAEVYNPATDTWTPVAAPHYIYESAGAVTLPDGRVLVAGGWQPAVMDPLGYTARRAAEIFDPVTGAWTLTGELNQRRNGGALILLAGGQPAYVGGAFGRIEHNVILESVVLSTAEIYDVASGTWKETAPMTYGRAQPLAVALPDGSALVAGGMGLGTTAVGPLAERLVPRPVSPVTTGPPATQLQPQVRRPAAHGRLAFVLGKLPKQLKPAATIAITLRCSGGPCHDRLLLRGRGRTLAQRDVTVAAPKTITVRLKLSAAARRALRHRTTRVTIRLQRQGTSVTASLRA